MSEHSLTQFGLHFIIPVIAGMHSNEITHPKIFKGTSKMERMQMMELVNFHRGFS